MHRLSTYASNPTVRRTGESDASNRFATRQSAGSALREAYFAPRSSLVSLLIKAAPAIRAHSDAFPRLRLSQGRREAMPAHDLRNVYSVRRTNSRCVDRFGSLAEILRANCRRCDYAKRLHVPASMVVEPVNGAARNAERLAGPDVDLLSVDRPGQHSVDAVDRLLVMVVAVCWGRKALRGRDREFEGRDAAGRVVPGEQEAHHEWPDMNDFLGRVNTVANSLLRHADLSYRKLCLLY